MKGKRIKVKNIKKVKELLRSMKKDNTVVKLIFLNFIKEGIDFEKACRLCEIDQSTGYVWIRKWNRDGYKGIKSQGSGR
ncbi:hypothetical protein JCM12298_17720 [Desulfothermus naphthae]